MELSNSGTEIKWLGHASVFIKNSMNIYIDPYNLPSTGEEIKEKADLVLLTHSHYDHCSMADLEKVVKPGTKVICPADCQSKVIRFSDKISMEVVSPGQEFKIEDVEITTIPAYNKDKPFHPQNEENTGYLLEINNTLIYHAGDTDKIEEMQKLTGYKQPEKEFVALLPVGGRFTMSAEEAAEAAKLIKPSLAIPIHYGSVIGSEEDAEEFKEICEKENIKVKVMEKE